MQWWTIEVLDAPEQPASGWRSAYGEWLVEVALTHGTQEWHWDVRPWGVVLEVAFPDEVDWLRFRATPGVRAALDAVPDPVTGLLVYDGRGGGSAGRVPRRPRPSPRHDGAALPLPEPEVEDDARPAGLTLCGQLTGLSGPGCW